MTAEQASGNRPNASAPAGTPALEFVGVSHVYEGNIRALSTISLKIHEGESVALCGANGSGKTTLLKLATGLLAPSEGRVCLAGEALAPNTRKQAFRKIGFLFQDAEDQLFCPTVRDDIAFGPNNLGLERESVGARVQQALDIMHIAHLADRPIHHLSNGEKKRVALAGLVAMQVPIMVLDEPTSGLDPASARELVALLHMLNHEHRYTMLVATHDIGRIPEFAGRVIVLRDGRVFGDGSPAEVLTDIPSLQAAALEAPVITQYFYLTNNQGTTNRRTIPLTLAEAVKLHKTQKEGTHA